MSAPGIGGGVRELESTTHREPETDIESDLDLLEQKITMAAATIERLIGEKKALEAECRRLRGERSDTVARLSRILEKVDAISGEA